METYNYYDIYGFSRKRDRALIEQFLSKYAMRQAIENRPDQDFGVYSEGRNGLVDQLISVQTLTEVIDYGIQHAHACFVFYIGDGLKQHIHNLILKFTSDACFIFGVCIEDYYESAVAIEQELKTLLSLEKTSIQIEYPPADNEVEFFENMALWQTMNEELKANKK